MNLPILASEIVKRVHHSPDSVTNLEQVVMNLIKQEIDRSASESEKSIQAEVLEAKLRRDFGLDFR